MKAYSYYRGLLYRQIFHCFIDYDALFLITVFFDYNIAACPRRNHFCSLVYDEPVIQKLLQFTWQAIILTHQIKVCLTVVT